MCSMFQSILPHFPWDVLDREEALVGEVGAALVQVVVEGEERWEDELNVKLVLGRRVVETRTDMALELIVCHIRCIAQDLSPPCRVAQEPCPCYLPG